MGCLVVIFVLYVSAMRFLVFSCTIVLCVVLLLTLFVGWCYGLSCCYLCLYVSAMRCLPVIFVCTLVLCVVFLLFLFVR